MGPLPQKNLVDEESSTTHSIQNAFHASRRNPAKARRKHAQNRTAGEQQITKNIQCTDEKAGTREEGE